MHRFFYEEGCTHGDVVRLPELEARHAAQVLRLRAGAEVILLNGAGVVHRAVLTNVSSAHVEASLREALPACEAETRITLFQGMPKADKMEWIVQKTTELGVAAVQPVLFSRCDKTLGKNIEKTMQRLSRIAREAVKQCGRGCIPLITPPISLEMAIGQLHAYDVVLLAWETPLEKRIADVVKEVPKNASIAVVIGPEGGIEKEEALRFQEAGAHLVTMGQRILRTETAGIAAISAILTLTGEL